MLFLFCVFLCCHTLFTPFISLFAPNSWSPMIFFAKKCCRVAAAKNVFEGLFFICLLHLKVLLAPCPKIQYANFLNIWNPWGKIMERSCLGFEKFLFKNGVKSPRQKKVFFFLRIFVICSLRFKVFLPPLPEVQCQFFFFLESLEKSFGKKWSQIVKLLLMKGLKLPCKKKVSFGEEDFIDIWCI